MNIIAILQSFDFNIFFHDFFLQCIVENLLFKFIFQENCKKKSKFQMPTIVHFKLYIFVFIEKTETLCFILVKFID